MMAGTGFDLQQTFNWKAAILERGKPPSRRG